MTSLCDWDDIVVTVIREAAQKEGKDPLSVGVLPRAFYRIQFHAVKRRVFDFSSLGTFGSTESTKATVLFGARSSSGYVMAALEPRVTRHLVRGMRRIIRKDFRISVKV
jgi:hypothetical protein